MAAETLQSFFAVAIGFAFAGMLTTGYKAATDRPASFRLLQRGPRPMTFAAVPFLDSTAANVQGRVAAKAHRQRIKLFITGATPAVRRALLTHGVSPPRARYRETIARAVADIKKSTGPNAPAAGGAVAS